MKNVNDEMTWNMQKNLILRDARILAFSKLYKNILDKKQKIRIIKSPHSNMLVFETYTKNGIWPFNMKADRTKFYFSNGNIVDIR